MSLYPERGILQTHNRSSLYGGGGAQQNLRGSKRHRLTRLSEQQNIREDKTIGRLLHRWYASYAGFKVLSVGTKNHSIFHLQVEKEFYFQYLELFHEDQISYKKFCRVQVSRRSRNRD